MAVCDHIIAALAQTRRLNNISWIALSANSGIGGTDLAIRYDIVTVTDSHVVNKIVGP